MPNNSFQNCSIREAIVEFQLAPRYREFPLPVRAAFQRVAAWLPERDAAILLPEITASRAKKLRDQAERQRGWRFANQTLTLIQAIVVRAVNAGVLTKNRVRSVPKILPPRQQSNQRRGVRPIRYKIPKPTHSAVPGRSTDELG